MSRLLQTGLHNLNSAIITFFKKLEEDPTVRFHKDEATNIAVRKEKDAIEITIPNYHEIGTTKAILSKVLRHTDMKEIGRISFFTEQRDAFVKVEKFGTY